MTSVGKIGKIASLDLFSGVGGLTHALRDVAHPVGYCDVSTDARDVLKTLMRDGKIPEAPVHPDVRTLDGKAAFEGSRGPTMIVGGFPCTAISVSGRREGLTHPGTGLFYEIMRLVDETAPDFVFLENVAAITETCRDRRSVLCDVIAEVSARGYDMRWGCFPAYAVGAPQRRHRWFCLCFKDSSPKTLDFGEYQRFDWSSEPATRMVPKGPAVRKRLALLGNSVVPDAVNLAFRAIWTGFSVPPEELFDLRGSVAFVEAVRIAPVPQVATRAHTRFGEVRAGQLGEFAVLPWMPKAPDMGIKLSAAVASNTEGYVPDHRAVPIEELTIPMWPSPRYCNGWRGARTLTKRGRGDLGTAVRFAETTTGSREGYTSAEFGEWLMGFPEGWTACANEDGEKALKAESSSDV